MKIIITIEMDKDELVNFNVEETKKESVVAVSQYARFFDETCAPWSKESEFNLMFLKTQEGYANGLLKSKGYLFLNDVYDMLGMPRTKTGQCVGWVYDENNPIGDNYVDFGIYEDRNSNFVNGYEKSVLLDFNVDGIILDYLK